MGTLSCKLFSYILYKFYPFSLFLGTCDPVKIDDIAKQITIQLLSKV